MTPEERDSYSNKITVSPPSQLNRKRWAEEGQENVDDPESDEGEGIEQLLVPIHVVEIRHTTLDGAVICKSRAAIYALSFDNESLTIMEIQSENTSPGEAVAPMKCTLSFFPFVYFPLRELAIRSCIESRSGPYSATDFGRFTGAERDALSLMYATSLPNERYSFHGEIVPHRGCAHLIKQR